MANHTALINILCEDHPGLIADVTGRLFDLGINLGDTSFAVLGGGAKFTLVAQLPSGIGISDVDEELRSIPVLKGAELSVAPFAFCETHGQLAHITHRIEITGDDSPGLIARLSEAFRPMGANIVELNSESVAGASGARFLLRMAVSVPKGKEAVCMATVANTAGQMNLSCRWEQV
ncbi:MAG TPA: ACT domain-containing protein [Dongiaceae bacterium]|jgi:glycine cleavage system transcriptional repressor|nr:ACT domain-containing protein [Dongiaceae bacterium]